MSAEKTKATIAGLKDLTGELSAWEGRRVYEENKANSLKLQNESLEKEMEEKKRMHNLAIERSQGELNAQRNALEATRQAIEAKKDELDVQIVSFRKEQGAFDKERDEVLAMKKDAEALLDKAGFFIRTVKDLAAKF